MEEHDLGGLIMFVGENIRYVTGTFQGNWKHNIFIRYAVLPRGGDPVLFETVGSDLECAKLDAPWLNGNIRPAFTWRWAEGAEPMMVGRMADSVVDVLKEAGVENEQIGIDTADMSAMQAFQERGLNLVNAWPAMSKARRIEHRCAAAHESLGDFQGLFAVIGLRDQQIVGLDAELLGIAKSSACSASIYAPMPPSFLGLGDDVQRKGSLSGRLRSVNLDDATTRHAADTERDIEPQGSGGDHEHIFCHAAFAELHDRAFAKLLFDLAYS